MSTELRGGGQLRAGRERQLHRQRIHGDPRGVRTGRGNNVDYLFIYLFYEENG